MNKLDDDHHKKKEGMKGDGGKLLCAFGDHKQLNEIY